MSNDIKQSIGALVERLGVEYALALKDPEWEYSQMVGSDIGIIVARLHKVSKWMEEISEHLDLRNMKTDYPPKGNDIFGSK